MVKIWKENIEHCSSYGACRFEKTCFEKNALKVLSWVWETPDTPQEKREVKQKKKFLCMKPFASYSTRFKLNFKQKKTDFLKNLHWCCPLTFNYNHRTLAEKKLSVFFCKIPHKSAKIFEKFINLCISCKTMKNSVILCRLFSFYSGII